MARRLSEFVIVSTIIGVLTLLPGYGVRDVRAQEQGQEGEEKPARKTKRTGSMSEKVYKRLSAAQQLVDAPEDQADFVPDFAGAKAELDAIKALPKLSPYEAAQMYNFYGYIYYAQERYQDALEAYRQVLSQSEEIPEGLARNTQYTIAQLEFVLENYENAIRLMNEWLADEPDPGAQPFEFLATAYYQLEQYENIIPPIERAMAIARERGKPVKEQWYLLMRVAYWELEDLPNVKDILEILVVNWPKKEYWTQLSAMYGELDQESRQLATYQAAYDQGLLQSNTELVQMAQLFLQGEVPYKAGKVLEKGFEDGKLDKNAKNYRLLSQAWQLAQEDDKAIPALKEAARLSDDGELYVRLAQSLLNTGQYKDCIDAVQKGFDRGGLKRKDMANLVHGMCLFETDSMEKAKGAFRRAAEDERSQKNATQWLNYIQSEQQRLRALEQQMESLRQAAQ